MALTLGPKKRAMRQRERLMEGNTLGACEEPGLETLRVGFRDEVNSLETRFLPGSLCLCVS